MVRTRSAVGELEIRSSADEAGREPGFLDLTGREIGRYRIQQRLGRGGITTVYQAYDTVDAVPVALKVLLHGNDEKLYNRFRHEAQTAAKLQHPHIVRTLRVGVTPISDTAYIAMELVEGEDLAAMLAMRRRLTPEESCKLLYPIALALSSAHEQGIVHRDVKPSNILLRTGASGDSQSVVLDALDYPVVPLLGDFGIARALDLPELTSWGRTVGTPAFMAPEQAQGQRTVDHRADIYALGAVFYRCVAGRAPFAGTTVQILHAHVYDSVKISEEVQRQLSQRHIQLLQRCLAKDPADRYADAQAMAADLLLGIDPTTDQLTPAEREENTTLTMELVAVGDTAMSAPQNVLVSVASEEKATTTAAQSTTTATRDEPVEDPHFDAELDQKLLRWSTWVLSIVLTIFALAVLFLLLRKPYQDLLNLFSASAQFSTPIAHDAGDPTARAAEPGGDKLAFLLAPKKEIRSLEADSLYPQEYPLPLIDTEPATAVAAPSVPAEPTMTATARLTTTPTPTASATATPQPSATAAPTNDPATPTTAAIFTVTADSAATIFGHCLSVTDAQLYQRIRTLKPRSLRPSFRCATEQAQYVSGEYLDFERGTMIYVHGLEKIFVSYLGNYNGVDHAWQDFDAELLTPKRPEALVTPVAPEDTRFYPTGKFGTLWYTGDVGQRLGMATTPAAIATTIVAQRFNQGWLLLREPAGEDRDATLHAYPIMARLF